MTTQPKRIPKPTAEALGLPPALGDNEQSAKLLIAAVLAAGTPGKEEVAIALLRKFGALMSEAVLKEVGGD